MFEKFKRFFLSLNNFIKGYLFLIKYNKANQKIKFNPVLNDFNSSAKFDAHYLYQGSWLAERLKETNPEIHYDFGSDIRLMSSLCHHHKIIFNDIFLPNLKIDNFIERKNNLYNLDFDDSSISSISCLHVLEHVGLGRYGDELNMNGHILAISELKRILKTNGNLFISTPIGYPCIYFNAHRVFSYSEFINLFNDFELVNFNYLNDEGNFFKKEYHINKISNNKYGCGYFWFKKK